MVPPAKGRERKQLVGGQATGEGREGSWWRTGEAGQRTWSPGGEGGGYHCCYSNITVYYWFYFTNEIHFMKGVK